MEINDIRLQILFANSFIYEIFIPTSTLSKINREK